MEDLLYELRLDGLHRQAKADRAVSNSSVFASVRQPRLRPSPPPVASARRLRPSPPPVSLVRPYGTSSQTQPFLRRNADTHNTSRPNLARKWPDRPQFSRSSPTENFESAGLLHGISLSNRNRLAEFPQKFQCDGYLRPHDFLPRHPLSPRRPPPRPASTLLRPGAAPQGQISGERQQPGRPPNCSPLHAEAEEDKQEG
jgi:hypothetical protein